ncbi:MAG: helix-turn-helix transcriptional regulator [Clostridia bacterium]|nr:helix-turn-helix transcriptional regulator [Clostridia bacterium]
MNTKSEINAQVGSRIRYYRKQRGFTLEHFASVVNKSRSVLSKYERGEIPMDVEFISCAAQKLEIPISFLINDDSWRIPIIFEDGREIPLDELHNMDKLYCYMLTARAGKPLLRAVVIHYNDVSAAMFCYGSTDISVPYCEYYYTGAVSKTESYTRIMAQNPIVKGDILILEFPRMLRKGMPTFGFVCAMSVGSFYPFATKGLIFSHPVTDDAWLKKVLTFNRDEMKKYQKKNFFFIPLESDHILYMDMVNRERKE